MIGRKGVGFKSVFSITSQPLVVSPPFTFRFDVDRHGPYGMICPEVGKLLRGGGKDEVVLRPILFMS